MHIFVSIIVVIMLTKFPKFTLTVSTIAAVLLFCRVFYVE